LADRPRQRQLVVKDKLPFEVPGARAQAHGARKGSENIGRSAAGTAISNSEHQVTSCRSGDVKYFSGNVLLDANL